MRRAPSVRQGAVEIVPAPWPDAADPREAELERRIEPDEASPAPSPGAAEVAVRPRKIEESPGAALPAAGLRRRTDRASFPPDSEAPEPEVVPCELEGLRDRVLRGVVSARGANLGVPADDGAGR